MVVLVPVGDWQILQSKNYSIGSITPIKERLKSLQGVSD